MREEMARVETNLRHDLAQVRLVAELDLDVDGELFKNAYEVLRQHLMVNPGAETVKRIPETFPATMVFVFTALGQHLGGADEYWQKIQEGHDNTFEIPGLFESNSSIYGKAFRDSLLVLGLPEFKHVNGRVNLVPLLLHGAIPSKDIAQVWRLVGKAISSGMESGDEIVAAWRKDPTSVQYLNKPVIRFVQETGRFAEDIIQRMVSALIELSTNNQNSDIHRVAARNRLPKIYVERLAQGAVGDLSRRIQIPNPTIFIDKYSGAGPVIRLPAVREDREEAMWHFTSKITRSQRAKNFDESLVQIDPAARWSYELTSDGERLKFREYSTLNGLDIWTFCRYGDEFRLRESSNSLDNEVVYLLAPVNARICINESTSEKLAKIAADVIAFGGEWSNYSLFELDLLSAKSVDVEIAELAKQTYPVVESPPRASIEGPQTSNLRDADGRRVFVAEPHLHFSKKVESPDLFTLEVIHPSGHVEENRLSSLPVAPNGYQLANSQLQQTGTYKVRLRGPLGSDLTDQFVLLPGAELRDLDGVFGPHEDVNGSITISGNFTSPLTIFAPRRRTSLKLSCNGGLEEIQLVVSIRRIEFCITGAGYPLFDNTPKQCSRDEFDFDGIAGETLWIRTCMLTGPELVWHDEFNPPSTRPISLKQLDSIIKIPLAQYREEIRSLQSPRAELQLSVPGHPPISLLAVGKDLSEAIETVRAETANEGYITSLFVHLSQGTARFANSLEMVNLDEPWRTATRVELVDFDPSGRSNVEIRGQVAPGNHRIRAYGATENRTVLLGETTVHLGGASEVRSYLEGLGNTKEDVLAKILRKGTKIFEISEESYPLLLNDVFKFLIKNINKREMKKQCDAAREFILLDGKEAILLGWLSEKLSDESLRNALEVLIIRLFPFMSDALRGAARRLSPDTLTRTWRASPLVGAIIMPTSHSAEDKPGGSPTEIDLAIRHEKDHWLGDKADFVPTFYEIFLEGKSGSKNDTITSPVHSPLLGFDALSNVLTRIHGSFHAQNSPESSFERESRELLKGKPKYRGPITKEVKDKVFGQNISPQDLRFCSNINYIFGLSSLMLDTSVPYERSTDASQLLSSQYLSEKSLVERIILETVTAK